jgi:hypothetical protein
MRRVELWASATPEQVLKFYEDKATAQGLKSINKSDNGIWHDPNMPQLSTNMIFTKSPESLSVTCKTRADGTSINLVYQGSDK